MAPFSVQIFLLGGGSIALNIDNSEKIEHVKERIEHFTHATIYRLVCHDEGLDSDKSIACYGAHSGETLHVRERK